jgi:hypothetical protein
VSPLPQLFRRFAVDPRNIAQVAFPKLACRSSPAAVFQMRFLTDIVSPYALRIAPVIGFEFFVTNAVMFYPVELFEP